MFSIGGRFESDKTLSPQQRLVVLEQYIVYFKNVVLSARNEVFALQQHRHV